jgi:ribulose 1,5-bisphosphate carboxylase large subunit-like protein
MITKPEMNQIIEEVARILKENFAPAFDIVKKDQEKVAAEFRRMAEAINGTDEEVKALVKRIEAIERRL